MQNTVEVFFQDEKYGEINFSGDKPVISGDRYGSLQVLLDSCESRLDGGEMTAQTFIASLHGHWWGKLKAQ